MITLDPKTVPATILLRMVDGKPYPPCERWTGPEACTALGTLAVMGLAKAGAHGVPAASEQGIAYVNEHRADIEP